jgi:hypothetical protein
MQNIIILKISKSKEKKLNFDLNVIKTKVGRFWSKSKVEC